MSDNLTELNGILFRQMRRLEKLSDAKENGGLDEHELAKELDRAEAITRLGATAVASINTQLKATRMTEQNLISDKNKPKATE